MTDDFSADVRREQIVWSAPDSVRFFSTHRDRVEDLYPSERHFLPVVVRQVRTVLDVGCAAGGFSRIMRVFNPDVTYTGVDVNPEFVELARQHYPECEFLLGDGIRFHSPPASYELVHSSGILHLNSQYEAIVAACYEQASRYLLCDFRLTRGPGLVGTFTIEFEAGDGARPALPYIVLNVEELIAMLTSLRPAPRSIRLHGYAHSPSPMASIPLATVLTTFVLIEKAGTDGATTIEVDLPPDAAGEPG